MKNHDFDNDYNIFNNTKYIVLYRKDKILQLEAFYRYHISCHSYSYNINELINFCKKENQYYDRFINKWVNNDNINILKIEYYDLINAPIEHIKKIILFTNPNIILNDLIIQNIIEKSNIKIYNELNKDIYDELKKII